MPVIASIVVDHLEELGMKATAIYVIYSSSVKLDEAQPLKATCQAMSPFCPVF